MWYYVLGAFIFGKMGTFFGLVDETASVIKNGYGLYQWWYTPRITQYGEPPHRMVLELQSCSTQTYNEGEDSDSSIDISSPELILVEQRW